ncbi:major capsid protein [Brevundimonas sp.]|uniref:major capsid protein n=1 Tax=Brevundimonas sp. TaxID=1871086 RepID=UPI002D244B70|nr:major capsid protein [Brevundimonas sp.]HYD26975.1 major capsid protein [Brevundimonas sp.]
MDPEVLEGASALPFLAADHVASINTIPSTFGQLNADGMFPAEGLPTAFVEIIIENGVIRALPATPDGRPSSIARHEKSSSIILKIPNVSHEDSVMAVDLRDWLAMARRSRDGEDTLAGFVEKRHRRNRLKFDMTLEVMKMGALKGLIKDGAGDTLYDLNSIFGVTRKTVYFDLANTSTNVAEKIEEVVAWIEDHLINETANGIEARVSPEFMTALINHASFQKYFLQTPEAQALLAVGRSQSANGFSRTFDTRAGLVLREYRARYTPWGADSTVRLIDEGEGHAYPTGTIDVERTYVAPPIDMAELGSVGDTADLIHMTVEPMKHGRGEEWAYQMNALPVWSQPALVVDLDDGADPG